MSAPDLSVSPGLAAQFGVQPPAPASIDPLARLAAAANAVAAAPNLPAAPVVDPNVPMGLPPLGTPIAPYAPPPQLPAVAPQQAAIAPAAPAPVVAPAAGGAPRAPDQMAGAVAEGKAAGQEATAAGAAGVDVARQSAEDLAKADELRAKEAEAASGRLTALQKRQESAFNESKAAFDQAKQDVSNFKFHDFFSNQTFASRVLSGIGMLVGGASYDANHQNQAVNVVQSAIKLDSDRQLAYLHSKEHLAELTQAGVRDTQSYLAHEMANFQMAEAFKKEAVAREIDSQSSATRGKQNVVAAQQVAAGLRQSAAKDAQAAILQGTHNRVMQSEIAKNNATTAHLRASASTTQDLKFEQQIAGEVQRFNKNIPKLVEAKNKVQEGVDAIDSGNPTATYAALEAYIRATSGLGARATSMKIFESHMGGAWSRFKNMVDNGATGGMDPGMVKNLRSALSEQGGSLDKITSTQAKLAATNLKRNPAFKGRDAQIDSSINQLFQLRGDEGMANAASDPNAEARAWANSHKSDPRAAQILQRIGG